MNNMNDNQYKLCEAIQDALRASEATAQEQLEVLVRMTNAFRQAGELGGNDRQQQEQEQ